MAHIFYIHLVLDLRPASSKDFTRKFFLTQDPPTPAWAPIFKIFSHSAQHGLVSGGIFFGRFFYCGWRSFFFYDFFTNSAQQPLFPFEYTSLAKVKTAAMRCFIGSLKIITPMDIRHPVRSGGPWLVADHGGSIFGGWIVLVWSKWSSGIRSDLGVHDWWLITVAWGR